MKYCIAFIFCFNIMIFWCGFKTMAQNKYGRFSFSSGASLSVTQLGISPFSTLRSWSDRSLPSIFLKFRYFQPLKKNGLTFGFQVVEKGFQTSYKLNNSHTQTTVSYSYNLNYLEMPALYHYRINRPLLKSFSFNSGLFVGYLFRDDFRIYQKDVHFPQNSSPYTNYTNLAGSYQWGNRFNLWDIGIILGTEYRINNFLSSEFCIQKGMIRVDNIQHNDLAYNVTLYLGLNYHF
jgi:hypothetical protein